MTSSLPPSIEDTRPAVKHLYRLLQLWDADTAYQRELVDASGHSRVTVERAMEDLIESGVVECAPVEDARYIRYRLVSHDD